MQLARQAREEIEASGSGGSKLEVRDTTGAPGGRVEDEEGQDVVTQLDPPSDPNLEDELYDYGHVPDPLELEISQQAIDEDRMGLISCFKKLLNTKFTVHPSP